LLQCNKISIFSLRAGEPAHEDGEPPPKSTYKEMQMETYDYAEIETYIAEARRMRSAVLGEYLASAWRALKRGILFLAGISRKDGGRHGPFLPA
jgi:hypothetical protein